MAETENADLDRDAHMQAGEAAALTAWQEILAARAVELSSTWTLPEQQRLKGRVLNRLAGLDKFEA